MNPGYSSAATHAVPISCNDCCRPPIGRSLRAASKGRCDAISGMARDGELEGLVPQRDPALGMKRHGDKAIDLERSRRMMHRPPRRVLQVPEDIRITEVVSEQGLRFDKVERIGAGAAKGAVILYYLHGGGYFFGSPKTHRPIIISLAKALDGLAYGLDYRLA